MEKWGGGVWVCFHWESWDELCFCITKIITQLYQNHDCMFRDLKLSVTGIQPTPSKRLIIALFNFQSKQPKDAPVQLLLN